MTTPSPKSPREAIAPSRELISFALIGVTGLALLSALVSLVPPDLPAHVSYLDYNALRLAEMSGLSTSFVSLLVIVPAVLAVVVAAYIGEPVTKANLVTVVALIQLGVALVLGLIFDLFLPVVNVGSDATFMETVKFGVRLLSQYAAAVVAGFVVFRTWHGAFFTPKPKPAAAPFGGYGYQAPYGQPQQQQYGQPGAYGQPPQQYGQPGSFNPGGAAPAGGAYGAPNPATPGQPGQANPYGVPQQQQYGQPGTYGQPPQQYAPGYGQPGQQPAAPPPPQPAGTYGQSVIGNPPSSVAPQPGAPAPASGDEDDPDEERTQIQPR